MSFMFEGDEVQDFLAKLPSVTVECPEAYTRGTVLNLDVEVRVKSVRLEEDRHGNLIRQHVFAVEAISIKEQVDPASLFEQAVVSSPADIEEETTVEDLGLTDPPAPEDLEVEPEISYADIEAYYAEVEALA